MTPTPEEYILLTDEEASFDTLVDIEKHSSDESRQQREHERIAVKAKVILQPGNSSEFLSFKVQGVLGNISAGGCQAMFPVPIQVGDVYRLHFAEKTLGLSMLFVRCVRCRVMSEDAYEAGFSFFGPITLSPRVLEKQEYGK